MITTGPLRAEAHDLGVDTARFIVGLAGSAEVRMGRTTHVLPPRHALVVLGDQPLVVESDEVWMRLEWHVMAVPSGLIRARVIQPVPFRVDAGIMRLLDSMTRSLIVEAPALDSLAQVFLYRLLSQTVVAAIADDLRLGSSRQRLFERAQFLIESEYVDPKFTVKVLCERLNVSRSYLYEVYAAYGTTPRKEMERHRIGSLRARADLDAHAAASELAGLAGFSSAQQLRDTVTRFEEGNPLAEDAWGRRQRGEARPAE
ncbi:hypothetical protein [Microbacterium sp.]|uniref:hypothetical protein n=1 Tax=Microbacterium sp. TaxID=51671 RepID=UPI00333EDE0F